MTNSILIADDNPFVRSLLVKLVHSASPEAHILGVDSGRAALEASTQHELCLAMLDHGLPDINGFYVMSYLKAHCKVPYIIIITGDPNLQEEALAQGADEVWVKPMDVPTFLQHLATLLPAV